MRLMFLIVAATTTAIATATAQAQDLKEMRGKSTQCIGGKIHKLEYTTVGLSAASFVDIDSMADKLSAVSCDIDHTRLTLNFNHRADATEWVVKFHDFTNHFIVGGSKWNCTTKEAKPQYILRRVVGASQGAHLGKDVEVTTAMARYDEVFETADISYSSSGKCDISDPQWSSSSSSATALSLLAHDKQGRQADKPICLAYNTECGGTATKPIPLFQNTHMDVTCTDCWVALKTDVFAALSISDWKVQNISGGFQNTVLNASMIVDVQASKSWSLALDKSLPIAGQTFILDFRIGSVPFMLYFDVPMQITGSLDFDTAAKLGIGTSGGVPIGDAIINWDPNNHWTYTKPTIDFSGIRPHFESQSIADISFNGHLQLQPTFNLHFDRLFSYGLTANPSVDVDVQGTLASKEICMTSKYNLQLIEDSEVDININIIDYHKDWTWGPTTIFEAAGNVLPQQCVHF